eukprot:jgi/Botrbrau1/5610/Bobra.97_2s0033.1
MTGKIVISILRAKELEGKRFRKLSPYVEVQFGSQTRSTSVAKHQDTDPDWDEELEFNDINSTDGRFVFTVYAKRHIKSDDFLGRGFLPLDAHFKSTRNTPITLLNKDGEDQVI